MIKTLTIFCLLLLGGCVSSQDRYRHLTVKNVDLDRFMGKWYVIASIPTMFEKDACNAVEYYEKKDDGSIHVLFTYHKKTPSGELKKMTQTAYIIDQETKAYWKVRPLWPLLFDYLVIGLDSKDYQYTIIGRPNKENVWIMARSATIPDSLYEKLLNEAVQSGYERHKIIKVLQKW